MNFVHPETMEMLFRRYNVSDAVHIVRTRFNSRAPVAVWHQFSAQRTQRVLRSEWMGCHKPLCGLRALCGFMCS